MAESEAWIAPVRGMLRIEMVRREMSYADLAKALQDIGVEENERNLRNKIARGTFSAVFFFQCLIAMKVDVLKLDMDYFPSPDREYVKVPTRQGWPK